MTFRKQKAMRSGEWKYLSIEGDEFLFNLEKDVRERANYAKRRPDVFEKLKKNYEAWDASLPTYPDATYSVVNTKADLATPS